MRATEYLVRRFCQLAQVGSNGTMPSTPRDQRITETRHRGGVSAPNRHWKFVGQAPAAPRVLRPSGPVSTRMELVLAGPIDVKPDPWQRFVAIGGLVTAVGSILSVFFVAVGLYVTNEANRKQQQLTAQGQITDRFTKAVEHLGQPGAEKVDVRLGAIYALERIMRDSAEDQRAVVDILAAFVRVHAPKAGRHAPTPMATAPAPNSVASFPRPPVDIQAALTVLGRRNATHASSSPAGLTPRPAPLDLTNTNLSGADLAHADLAGADLAGADLTGAYLAGAYLARAHLADASLADASLTDASLTDANLADADLTDAYLVYADLTGAYLANADLTDAELTDANLTRVTLTNAELTLADLTDANLAGANLTGANLNRAYLTRADLALADLTDAELTCAKTDDDTRLPNGVARPTPC
ncbi:pentapeptide repeat-containing protein [Micromonospora sp. CPCC 205558]|uniref:pentapeptide repeat-containing protein n=1 Tax=Micromonospora sp. CPCC 205558 TaxID=3122403 RepID=UPI002FF2BAF4